MNTRDLLTIDLALPWSYETASRLVKAAPRLHDFGSAMQHAIAVIGAIAYRTREAGHNVRIYLGRTAARGSRVAARFRDHSDPAGRDHQRATVLFRGRTPDVVRWEGALNRVLGVLGERRRLHIANVAGDGRGPITRQRLSAVYLTWEVVDGPLRFAPTSADITAISRALRQVGEGLPVALLQGACATLTRPEAPYLVRCVNGPRSSPSLRSGLGTLQRGRGARCDANG